MPRKPRAMACAIVPPRPNALTVPWGVACSPPNATPPNCVGSTHVFTRREANTCEFTIRSCAFGPTSWRSRRSIMDSKPAVPAAGSACPRLPLSAPTSGTDGVLAS
eukprot:scaffold60268_cov27-Tisochrysis_lutea.AAC.18